MPWRHDGVLWLPDLPLDEAVREALATSRMATPDLTAPAAAGPAGAPVDPQLVLEDLLASGTRAATPVFLRVTEAVAAGATKSVSMILPPPSPDGQPANGLVRPLDGPGLPALVLQLDTYGNGPAVTVTAQVSGAMATLLEAVPLLVPVSLPAALLPPWLASPVQFTVTNAGTSTVNFVADLRAAAVTGSVRASTGRAIDRALQGLRVLT